MKKKQKKIILTLLGLPGSGKGTQGKLIAKELNFGYISTGALVRQACFYNKTKNIDSFCKRVRAKVQKGIPQPDTVIKKLLLSEIKKMKIKNGLILDSYPLSKGQIKDFLDIKKLIVDAHYYVLFLQIDQKTIVNRLSKRKICPKDDIGYTASSIYYKKGTCKCGTKLVVRDDDKPKVVRARIREYKERFDILLKYFKQTNQLIIVNAKQDINKVHKEAIRKIKEVMFL